MDMHCAQDMTWFKMGLVARVLEEEKTNICSLKVGLHVDCRVFVLVAGLVRTIQTLTYYINNHYFSILLIMHARLVSGD